MQKKQKVITANVTEEAHRAIRFYSAKKNISFYEAASELILIGEKTQQSKK